MPAARSLAVAWEWESFLASVLATAAARMAVMRAENCGGVSFGERCGSGWR